MACVLSLVSSLHVAVTSAQPGRLKTSITLPRAIVQLVYEVR